MPISNLVKAYIVQKKCGSNRIKRVDTSDCGKFHTCFDADRLALSAVEIIGTSAQLVKVHLGANIHLARVNLHDACACLLIGLWEFDFSI